MAVMNRPVVDRSVTDRPSVDRPVMVRSVPSASVFTDCPRSSSLIKGTLANDTVILKIAGKTQEYHVNKPLLCEKSAFFAKAFQEHGMKESAEGRIELHDVKLLTLEAFIYWVYTGIIQLPDGSELIAFDTFHLVVRLYNFADVYDTFDLRNDIVSKIYNQRPTSKLLTFRSGGWALKLLRHGSKLYSLLLDFCLASNIPDEPTVKIVYQDFPQEAAEMLFTNLGFKTFKGMGGLGDYLESDESR